MKTTIREATAHIVPKTYDIPEFDSHTLTVGYTDSEGDVKLYVTTNRIGEDAEHAHTDVFFEDALKIVDANTYYNNPDGHRSFETLKLGTVTIYMRPGSLRKIAPALRAALPQVIEDDDSPTLEELGIDEWRDER